MRLLFVVAFLQVFSLQNCFALFDEDQALSTPLRSPTQESIFSPLTTPAPSTPLQSPPEESIFSPTTNLKDQLSPIFGALAVKSTEGPVSRKDMKEIYRKYGFQFLTGLWLDIDLIDLEKSIKLMRRGRNPVTRKGKKLVAHHVTLTPTHLALFPEDIHQGKDQYIVTKKDRLSGKASVVATRLTKQRAEEIKKECEAQALANGENVEFHRKGNLLHAAKGEGPSQINRVKFNVERERIFKDLSKKLDSLQLGSS